MVINSQVNSQSFVAASEIGRVKIFSHFSLQALA